MKHEYITLKNGNTTAVISRVGGELVSLKVKGVEVMFQGKLDPENNQWDATAKNLFPSPGPVDKTNEKWGELKEVEVEINGKKKKFIQTVFEGGLHPIGQHGFAWYSEFNVHNDNPTDHCIMSLGTDHSRFNEYPFDFIYYVGYQVESGGKLSYQATAQNKDVMPMLGGMGWHPAFQLHADPSKYVIRFKNLSLDDISENDRDEKKPLIPQEGVDYSVEDVIKKGKGITFSGIKSVDVELLYDDGIRRVPYVTMHSEEPYIVLWSKARDPEKSNQQTDMICIEPWNTPTRQIQNLTTRDKIRDIEDAVIVEPGEQKTLRADIQIGEEYILELVKVMYPEEDNSSAK